MKKIYTLFILFILIGFSLNAQTRYWVNGNGDWNDNNHWSDVSGGQGGFSIPNLYDDVYIDNNSINNGKLKININEVATAKSINTEIKLSFTGINDIITYSVENISKISFNDNTFLREINNPETRGAGDAYTVSCNSTNETCPGDCDGTITIDYQSGIIDFPITIILNGDENDGNCSADQTITGINSLPYTFNGICGCGTDYSIVVLDVDNDISGCDASVTAKAPMNPFETITNETCPGDCDGEIKIDIVFPFSGNPYSYSWSNGGTTNTISNLCANNYSVTITDKDGCTEIFPYTVTSPPAIVIDDSTYSAFICDGGANGFINVNASGGTGTLVHDIGGGTPTNNDGNFTGLSAGTYTITITDDNGCTNTSGPYILQDNAVITISDTHVNPLCNGDSNGSINITVNGGTTPYTFSWQTADGSGLVPTDEDQTGLTAGTYDLTVTDAVNCTKTYSVTLTENGVLTLTTDATQNIQCNGGNDGIINITIGGGTGAGTYNYNWTTADGSGIVAGAEDQNTLTAGTYDLTVSDGNGCSITDTWTLTEPTPITITEDLAQNIACNGGNDGIINITVGGGAGGFIYNWQTADGSGLTAGAEDQSGLTAGTYDLTVTDANNCTQTQSWTLTEPTAITITEDLAQNISCNGNNDGIINITVSGGAGGFVYNWQTLDGSGLTAGAEDQSGLTAGTYDLTVTDANNCTQTQSWTLTEPTAITITEDLAQNISCNGNNDGIINITLGGGAGGFVYNWQTADGSGLTAGAEDQSGLTAGTYDLTVTDANNCTQTQSWTLTEPTAITITEDLAQNISCNGNNDGIINITVGGGAGGFIYNWQTADGSGLTAGAEDQSGLTAGTYDLTVTDANNCTQTQSWTLTEPLPLNVSETHVDPTCNSNNNGSIDLTVSGGTGVGTYSYNWFTADGSGLINGQEDQTGLTAGTYDVTITDANLCSQTLSILLSDPNAILLSETHNDVSCNGYSDGDINLTTNGGTPPYSWNWENQANPGISIGTTEDLSGLSAGTYCVTVTDNGPCTESLCVTIIEPAGMTITTDSTSNPNCNGDNNGNIYITITGGTGAGTYSYNWTTVGGSGIVAGAEDQTTLTEGTYNLTVTDGNGCEKTDSWVLTDPAVLNVSETHVSPTCNSGNNGSIDLTVTGGSGVPYTYNWVTADGSGLINGQEDQTGLTAGTYDVTITDGNNCSQTLSILLNDPNAINITETHNNVSCNGYSDGDIDITVTGGTPPYTFNWEDQANPGVSIGTGEDISNLSAGTYCVYILDGGPCPASMCITITEPAGMTITTDSTVNVTCNSGNDGAIYVSIAGGTTPYIYTWQTLDGSGIVPGQEDQTTLTAGTYNLTVADANGCEKIDNWTITEPNPIVITTDGTSNPTCNGGNNGTINITISDGVAPYTYTWQTADGSGIIAGQEDQTTLTDGTYNLTVTDANNCTQTDSWTIVEPTPVTITLDGVVDVTCNGGSDGGINISVNGGTVAGAYTYNWEDDANPGISISTTEDLAGVSIGTYNVTVTDDNGCTSTGSWTINEPAPITFTTETSTNITCFGSNDGTIDVLATNGVTPYSYDLGLGSQAGGSFGSLSAGTYNVTVTDNNLCTAVSGPYTIVEPDSLQASFYNITQNVCDASCNGTATLSINGGTVVAGYTYNWNPVPATINNDTSLTDLCPNTYNVTVTDDNGCTDTSSVTIIEIIPITITEENLVNLNCNGVCDGEVEISVTANNPPYSILWSNGDTDTLAQNLCAGTHTVTITDVNTCTKDTTFTIIEPTAITYSLDLVHNRCFGDANGQVTVHVIGGTPPYSFDFGSGFTTDSVNSNLTAGGYSVTITDANNCSVPVANFIIQQPSQLTTSTIINSQPSCAGICDGNATTTANGGTTPYAYLWTSGEITANATALCNGWAYVTITDDSLCTLVDSVQIIEPTIITVNYDTTNVKCNGDCNGEIAANVSGGTTPYTFAWQGGGSTPTISNLCVGDYYLTITDNNSCQFTDTIAITEPLPINLGFNAISNVSCYGQCDGSATAIASGGSGNFVYAWANLENTATASTLCAGYTAITVTDDSLCTLIDSVNIIQPDSIQYTIETNNPSCNSDCDGNVIVHVIGGTTPYSFDWGSGANINDSILANQCSGNYSVTITDGNGCSAPVANATINEYPVITANITDSTMLNCYEECIGTATVTAGGGTGIYNYSWSNSDNTNIADSLCAQTYFVTVSDDNSCTAVDSVIITQPDSISISFTNITQVDCGGGCTGEATISVIGGTPTYTYAWPDGQTVPTIDTLCANIYEITVTDINLCTNTAQIEIIDTSDLAITASVINHITCNGLCDGSAFAVSTGGYPPYNYSWNTTPITNNDTATSLCAQTYFVTVVDDSLCSRVAQVTIDESVMLVANENATNPSCNGTCDGEAWINITGGATPYNVNWETTATDTIISNLCEDWYSYTVIDGNNCQINDSIQIIDPNILVIDITDSLNINCFNDSTGFAVITANGGTTPYSYIWSNGSTDTIANNLWAGTHFVTVQDAGGCSAIDSVTLTQGDSIYVDFINIINPHCGECNGEITAVGGGGTPGFTYQWGVTAMNSTDSAITNLCVNVYDITVTDANSCDVVGNYVLNDTSSLAVNVIDSIMANCSYTCDGSVTVEGINGIAPYSYSWSTGDLDSMIENQCVGYYYVTIQDAQSCQNIDSVEITGPDELIISVDSIRPLGCSGDCNGEITVSATGGTPIYNFLWSTSDTDTLIYNLCQGNYSVTITDSHNCVDSLDTVLTAPIPIVLTFNDSIPLCNNGSGDGKIELDVQGGVPGYSYLWSNSDTTVVINNLDGGWYTVSVTDTVGCQVVDSTYLGSAITVTATADSTTTICISDSVQLYGTAFVSDGTGYNFVWHPGTNMVDSNAQNPLVFVDSTTVFYFEVLHNNGICYDIDSVIVSTYPTMNVDAGEDITILYDQDATLEVVNPMDSTTYFWVPSDYLETPNDYITVASPEVTTMYFVVATSQYGCVETDSVLLTVIPELIIPNGITPNGDGINDVWMLDYSYLFPDIEVEVFNRWGEQMFYSKGYPDSDRWDGNYKGKPLPTGTYYYIIKLNDGIHKDPFTGPITVVR